MLRYHRFLSNILLSLTVLAVPALAASHPAHPAKPALKKAAATAAEPIATIATVRGPIVIRLFTKQAPLTAGNFIKLAKKGFYNGLTFHRVVPGFVIQGGDPKGDGSGGPGYTIKLEKSATLLHHVPGSVAMARTSDPDSAGSQFYICLGKPSFLDGQYAVFGQVIKGMDAVKKIKKGDRMTKVTISYPAHA